MQLGSVLRPEGRPTPSSLTKRHLPPFYYPLSLFYANLVILLLLQTFFTSRDDIYIDSDGLMFLGIYSLPY